MHSNLNKQNQLGEAATSNAIESQISLLKLHFNQLLDIIEQHQLYGLNVAHNGSVVGLFFFNSHQHMMIQGGIR